VDGVKKRLLLTLILIGLAATLSGCLFRPVDELYSLPERFPGYESLEMERARVIEELKTLNPVVENANILSGKNTAIIQLLDLDGDGVQESAVTFFRVSGEEKALKIYVFSQDDEGNYSVRGVIQGEGMSIYAIDYVDINGIGEKEVVVSWQTALGGNKLGIYSFDYQERRTEGNQTVSAVPTWENLALQAKELRLVEHSGFYNLLDINQDGRIELAVPRIDSAGTNSYVEVYAWGGSEVVSVGTAPLSAGITVLNKMRANYLAEYIPALYITSTLADTGKALDIITFQNGVLTNISLDPETAVSKDVLREYTSVEPVDINNDSILEVPRPRMLPTAEEEASGTFWLIEWIQYDVNGNEVEIATTYHNTTDEWYFVIPEAWKDVLVLSQNNSVSGQRAVIFSYWEGPGKEPENFLTIYRLTGQNRFSRATLNNRFQLEEDATAIYSATFYEGSWNCGLDQNGVMENFGRIFTGWGSE